MDEGAVLNVQQYLTWAKGAVLNVHQYLTCISVERGRKEQY